MNLQIPVFPIYLDLSEVNYGEVRVDRGTVHIRVAAYEGTRLYCEYFIW